MRCSICPRACGADRSDKTGFCRCPKEPVVARAALHFWEEPCISGKNGSGAIFFCGCSLRCVFCQNSDISRDASSGKRISTGELALIMKRLEEQGAHNINFVNPTHYADAIISTCKIYRPKIPIVYNSGGYDSVETLKKLEGIVDIYLPDYKYADNALAKRFSGADDLPEITHKAIAEMIRQTGPAQYDENGMMTRGALIRHLILPGHVMNSIAVLKRIGQLESTPVSIMAQYTPKNDLSEFPELQRKLTQEELDRVTRFVERHGIEGYIQSLESAGEGYIPAFDGTGVS